MHTRSSRSPATASRTTRGQPRQRHVCYKEASSDDSATEGVDLSSLSTIESNGMSSSTLHGAALKPLRKRKPTATRFERDSPKKIKSKSSPRKPLDSVQCLLPVAGGRNPPWQTLPYEILLQIFHYASNPLCDDLFKPTPAIGWLLRTALICKAFAEPSLSVLYYAPPLSPPSRAQGLVAHLASQGPVATYNYRNKVKYVDIEAMSTLMLKYAGRDPIDLAELFSYTPQLRGVGLHFISDQPKYQKMQSWRNKKTKPVYRISVIEALEDNRISLRSWKWNFELDRPSAENSLYPWSVLKKIHMLSPFQSLHSLAIVNYRATSGKLLGETQVAEAISTLPKLRKLSFELSHLLKSQLLGLLPNNLESLHIVDCSSVTSEMLRPFLTSHGTNIRELILNHNRSLSLSFLVGLATSCPNLEILTMNLTYYNSYYTSQDSEPGFEVLLLPDEIPEWPTNLHTLELLHLRKWNSKSTEMFFQSLIDSASSLLHLRKLILKASIEIGWRDRASFRDQWIRKLQKVFLRHCTSPDPNLRSLQAYDEYKNPVLQPKQPASSISVSDSAQNSGRPGLRCRLSHAETNYKEAGSESESDIPIATKRRAITRFREQDHLYIVPKGPSSLSPSRGYSSRRRYHASDDSVVRNKNENTTNTKDGKFFIQGMCEVVDIRIDNLRPAEDQFDENDFLDEEPSGDEDWNGDDALPGDGKYAW
ncbi:hypothetical protein MMC06_000489 [Schaereria dolodes]|nr:hypothetical protein [Schaereria dolodes]